jgi:hypothetical protein
MKSGLLMREKLDTANCLCRIKRPHLWQTLVMEVGMADIRRINPMVVGMAAEVGTVAEDRILLLSLVGGSTRQCGEYSVPFPFLMDTDYRWLYIPKKLRPSIIYFGKASITIHFRENGVPDDIPLDVLQEAVASLWSKEDE